MLNKYGFHSSVYGLISIVGILSIFLPWITISNAVTLNGTNTYGWISLPLWLIVLYLINQYKKESYPKIVSYSIGLLGFMIAVIGAFSLMSMNSNIVTFEKSLLAAFILNTVKIEYGVIVLIASGALLSISIGVLEFIRVKKKTDVQNEMHE